MGVVTSNMCHTYQTCGHIYPQMVIGNIIVIIVEGDKGNGIVGYHTPIISYNLGWPINSKKNYNIVVYFHGKISVNHNGHQ